MNHLESPLFPNTRICHLHALFVNHDDNGCASEKGFNSPLLSGIGRISEHLSMCCYQ